MLPDSPKPSGYLIMQPSSVINYWLGWGFMCVCCSLGSQRSPPVPQGSTGRELVQIHIVLGLGAPTAICKCLVTSLCFLTVWVSLAALRSHCCSLKKQQRVQGVDPSWHSSSIWIQTHGQPGNPQCLICWVCFAHGPAQFVGIWQTQMFPAHKHPAVSWQRLQLPRQPCKLRPAASHKTLNLASLAAGCSSHSCPWKHPKNTKKSLFHGEHSEAMEMPFGKWDLIQATQDVISKIKCSGHVTITRVSFQAPIPPLELSTCLEKPDELIDMSTNLWSKTKTVQSIKMATGFYL